MKSKQTNKKNIYIKKVYESVMHTFYVHTPLTSDVICSKQ